jgi:import receptor subunit TOM70
MSNELPLPSPAQNVVLDTSKLTEQSSASVWDRITGWVSENKAVVYTIAGVAVVVTGAGVVYYLNDNSKATPSVPKKSKKQRRTEKKKAEDAKKAESVKEGR